MPRGPIILLLLYGGLVAVSVACATVPDPYRDFGDDDVCEIVNEPRILSDPNELLLYELYAVGE